MSDNFSLVGDDGGSLTAQRNTDEVWIVVSWPPTKVGGIWRSPDAVIYLSTEQARSLGDWLTKGVRQ